MKKILSKSYIFLSLWLLVCNSQAQENLLASGPMLGYSTMKEVAIWVQTKATAKVHFVYFDQANPTQKLKTEIYQTEKKNAFTATLIAEVQPNKKYTYELYINDKLVKRPYPLTFQSQTHWQYRTDPPAIKFVYGSCNFTNEVEVDRLGNPYGGDHRIFKTIADKKPDFMVWGGDNVYLREVDFDSRTGILHRYTHARALPEWQELMGSVHHYATWDDHEYGPNDSDRSYVMKRTTLEAFKLFWANPNYVFENEGVTGQFLWGDAEFFLLDDRYFRSPNNGNAAEGDYFGEKQLNWVIDALTASQSPFKFIVSGGQILNSLGEMRSENYAKYKKERELFLQKIKDAKIQGVIFLTGDRHHVELSKMEREGTYPLHDFTISPLTAGSAGDRAKDEKNMWRVPDTYFGGRNFCMFEIIGKRKERILTATLFDTDGKEIWKREIKEQELK